MTNFKALRIVQEIAAESMPSIYWAKENNRLVEWREQWAAIEAVHDMLVEASADGHADIRLVKESRFS
jgi:hypothetical protein